MLHQSIHAVKFLSFKFQEPFFGAIMIFIYLSSQFSPTEYMANRMWGKCISTFYIYAVPRQFSQRGICLQAKDLVCKHPAISGIGNMAICQNDFRKWISISGNEKILCTSKMESLLCSNIIWVWCSQPMVCFSAYMNFSRCQCKEIFADIENHYL